MTTSLLDLDAIRLEKGAHQPDHTFCVMELSAYLAQEPWSDHPACVSPIIGAFLRSWNDAVDDEFRQQLKPYAAKVLHTNTEVAHEEVRAWLLTDWQVRISAPAWLELAGLHAEATSLRGLPIISNAKAATAATPTIRTAAKAASAAGDAARAAARAAAWDAARAAAWAAAWDAAWDAARAAAWAAAWDAATERLAPTVTYLQGEAFKLLDALIAVSKP